MHLRNRRSTPRAGSDYRARPKAPPTGAPAVAVRCQLHQAGAQRCLRVVVSVRVHGAELGTAGALAAAVGVQHDPCALLRPACPTGCARRSTEAAGGCPEDEGGQGADHLLLQTLQAHKVQRRAHPQPATARPRQVETVPQVQRHGRNRRACQRPVPCTLAGARVPDAAVAR